MAAAIGVSTVSVAAAPPPRNAPGVHADAGYGQPVPRYLDAFSTVRFRKATVDGVRIAYREAGSPRQPTLVLLHGFPSSSHAFRDLVPLLAKRFHVVAPDYPGFGNSDTPSPSTFDYTFDHLAVVMSDFLEQLHLNRYALYVHDYGGPVGYRIAAAHPQRVTGLIVQNAIAYDGSIQPGVEKLIGPFWENRTQKTEAPVRQLMTPEGTKSQYTYGARNLAAISPDSYQSDQAFLDRPGAVKIQLDLLYDYRNNPAEFPTWQAYFRRYQPPTLIVWGRQDGFFKPEGATAYLRDLPKASLRYYDTGHFALEEDLAPIAARILKHFHPRVY